ncbi:MAG: radical SAM protein [Syntrophaceae bacterium]
MTPSKKASQNTMLGKICRPFWASELLDFYIRRKLFKQRNPLFASFKLTYHCNLSCSACPFHGRASDNNSHITWDTAIAALEILKKRGVKIVIFEGGEPFLWRDGSHGLHDLVMYAKRLFLRVAVTTNGTFPLNVPSDVLWVSIDGLNGTHDRLRSGSFERMWSNLKSATHPRVMVHFTINRDNWCELNQLAEKLTHVPMVKGLSVQLFYPYDQGESPLSLSPEERKSAIENVIKLKKYHPIINSTRCLQAMIRNDWRCHDDVLMNVDPDGTITQGCYVKSRGKINCKECGFTPVAEASSALDLQPGSILAGWRAYLS